MAGPTTVLVTGGAGFIGSAACRHLIGTGEYRVINVDKLTYSGNLDSLREIEGSDHYRFVRADICDQPAMLDLLRSEQADKILHLAAESHVDRSIDGPDVFVRTNVEGTVSLLNAALAYWRERGMPESFRFHHVSTDEVFGDLDFGESAFHEESPYAPSSPYSASKAAADHFVRAWRTTYGLPVVLSNTSNNYGPYHFPEKLIPLVILNALEEQPLPVYGVGANVRDWLYVDDHARALELVMMHGRPGASYNIGGRCERNNLAVVEAICAMLDVKRPRASGKRYKDLIRFVADRPGHDRRYAIDPSRIEAELGWKPAETFETGLEKTVDWFLANEWWWRPIREGNYAGERLGRGA
ncbi:MAG TPA: dTDP-glucose 4,6-dehydratase [Sphingomicrobium sp.]|nr:dTDP-glucose 4,6-dehydratase [Sphingomicrobium sp.]